MTTEEILAAVEAVIGEAQRRALGLPHDRRFDVPLSMLEDLAEELALTTTASPS